MTQPNLLAINSNNCISISQGDDWIRIAAGENQSEQDRWARLDNFISLLEGRSHTVATIQHAYEVQKLVEAILSSG